MPDSTWTPEQVAGFCKIKFEIYVVPVPLLKVHATFNIFPDTKIINPNELIFSSTIGVAAIPIQKMWEMEPAAFYTYLQEEFEKNMKESEKRIQLN